MGTSSVNTSVQRIHVVQEAKTWLGTPYRTMARVKGKGCDCATFLAGVYEALGVVPHVETGTYAQDWHFHKQLNPEDEKRAERYLRIVQTYADEMPVGTPPLPGDVAMWGYGLRYAHGAIVIEWPTIIEAQKMCGVCMTNALWEHRRANMGLRIFRIKHFVELGI